MGFSSLPLPPGISIICCEQNSPTSQLPWPASKVTTTISLWSASNIGTGCDAFMLGRTTPPSGNILYYAMATHHFDN